MKLTWQMAPLFLAVLAYAPVWHVGFLVEDHVAIEQNQRLDDWSLNALGHDFRSNLLNIPGTRHYRPLLTLLNRLDKMVWGLRPLGFHMTSLALHVACVWLGMQLMLKVSQSETIAALTAAFFAVHPIGVHTQLIIMAREEPLSYLWSLATILLALRPGRKSLLASLCCYMLALFSKESAVVTPIAFLLVLWCMRGDHTLYRRAVYMLACTVPYLWIRSSAVGPVLLKFDVMTLKILAFKVTPTLWWSYLGTLAWPFQIHYPHPLHHLSHAWPFALSGILILGLWTWRQENRFFFWAWGWYTLWLFPHLLAIPEIGCNMAHWAYPGSLGFFGMIAWLLLKVPLKTVAVALVAYWSFGTYDLIRHQKTDAALHRWTLRFEPDFGFSLFNLGSVLLAEGKKTEAAYYLQRYLLLYGDFPDALRAQTLLRQAQS